MAKLVTPYIHTVTPAMYLQERQQDAIAELLAAGLPPGLSLRFLRRRRRWMCTLPAAFYVPDGRVLTRADEKALAMHLISQRRLVGPLRGFRPERDVEFDAEDGHVYYSEPFLREVGPHSLMPHTAAGLAEFLAKAKEPTAKGQQPLIPKPKAPSKQRYKPPELRVSKTGRPTRGPKWEEWEDKVLRKWFARRSYDYANSRPLDKPQHMPLTDAMWDVVLRELEGRRTKANVKARITVLNRQLRKSMLVDGFLSRDDVRKFQEQALGETPVRVPRYRPRIYGRSYRGDNARPVVGQPA